MVSKTEAKKKIIFAKHFWELKTNKYTKTQAKHHRKTLERNKSIKTEVRSQKWVSKTEPKKKVIFTEHFGNKKPQKYAKTEAKHHRQKHNAATKPPKP